ncbi:MAG: Rpn family recombination-promoting nuclease/putative transposase [Oscillospiraceae bacterium]|jgi:predicted transposase/invertase (TIGR01784 family)|nr:Rpn family recombination-promoting nuclease/putative transposase [Oscillospiraceae bacterium]
MKKLEYTFKSDILFKMTLVKHQRLLRRLVAEVLKIRVEDIQEFVVLNGEIVPEAIGKKFCRLDIHLKINGEYVDVEMQVSNEGNFRERLLVYWSKVFAGALGEGEDYREAARTILISFVNFNLFNCAEYTSEFAVLEKRRYELLTDKMSIFVFELGKLPKQIDANNVLELFLRAFRADTEEELENFENTGVAEMKEMITAYRDITSSPDYVDLERKRLMNRLDEGQALRHARELAAEEERAKWQSEREAMAAEIARLRAQLGE